ncbi:hypothetical protein [Polaromonas sp. LjRoot131]|uniref:hypothetical protein n=1 Tax=Polaromonas sp. LjRoot131 TaxID=3342262 RepID=UPI003ECCDC5F
MPAATKKVAKKVPAKKVPAKKVGKKVVARKPTTESRSRRVPRLAIRMYRHGLGDCLLLRFSRKGMDTFNVLIDCGIIMVATDAKKKMEAVVNDIAKACAKRIDVVVMTHEHWDHASGFSTQHARSLFDEIEIGEVWYGWTEDPTSELGQRLRKERAEKVKALTLAVRALNLSSSLAAKKRVKGLTSILGFFGIDHKAQSLGVDKPIQKTRDAFEYLMKRRGVKTRYLYPDKPPISIPGVADARVFVLGPPQNEAQIKKSAPSKKDREVYELASEASLATSLGAAFGRVAGVESANGAADDCPFDATLHMSKSSDLYKQLVGETWDAPGQEWRQIEEDWTQAAETLALNLDSHTNNTCVVLAFEFSDTGEVFLFPADAQVGNWLSWQDLRWRAKTSAGVTEVTGPELLERTVFYKVGHHGSHNATLRKLGLEQMTSEDLLAFIPVIEGEAVKSRWLNMPFSPLLERLKTKTGGRLLRSDSDIPAAADLSALPKSARTKFLKQVAVGPNDLYFEYRFD